MPKSNGRIIKSKRVFSSTYVGGCGITFQCNNEKHRELKIRLHKKKCEKCFNAIRGNDFNIQNAYTFKPSNTDLLKNSYKQLKEKDIGDSLMKQDFLNKLQDKIKNN